MTPVEEFLAKGGKIKQIQEGIRSSDERTMYLRVRGNSAEAIINKQFGGSLNDSQYMVAVERLKIERGF